MADDHDDHALMLPGDVRRLPYWEDDETVKELRELAAATGVSAYIQLMLDSPAVMGDQDIEALCAVADILGLSDRGDDDGR